MLHLFLTVTKVKTKVVRTDEITKRGNTYTFRFLLVNSLFTTTACSAMSVVSQAMIWACKQEKPPF